MNPVMRRDAPTTDDKDLWLAEIARLEADKLKLEAENLELSGWLADARERLRSYELAETIANKTRAKRHMDVGDGQ